MRVEKKTGPLLGTLHDPARYAPRRLPVFPAERTSVTDLNLIARAFVGTNDTRMMLTRQAAYPLWVDWNLAKNLTYYMSAFSYAPSLTGSSVLYDKHVISIMAPGTGQAPLWTGGTTTKPGFPGFVIPSAGTQDLTWKAGIAGRDSTDPLFVYVPTPITGGIILQMADDASADFFCKVAIEVWQGPGEWRRVVSTPQLVSSTGANKRSVLFEWSAFSLQPRAWVRPVEAFQDTATGDWPAALPPALYLVSTAGFAGQTLSLSTNISILTMLMPSAASDVTGPLMPLAPPPELYSQTQQPFSNTKVTAAACAVRNVTKVLNKEGIIICGRLKHEADSYRFNAGTISALHPAEKDQIDLELGVKTFTIPAQDINNYINYIFAFAGTQDYSTDGLSITMPVMDLSSRSPVNCMSFIDADGATTLSVVVDWHLEFRHRSTLWELKVPDGTLEQLHSASARMARMPLFLPCETTRRAERGLAPAASSSLKPGTRPATPKKKKSVGKPGPTRMWYNGGQRAGPPPKPRAKAAPKKKKP